MRRILTIFVLLLVIQTNYSPTPPVKGSIFTIKDILECNLKDKEGRGVVDNVLYIIEDDMVFRSINRPFIKDKIINSHPFSTLEDPYREDLHGKIECSCVRYTRSLGLQIPYNTDAINIKPNTRISIGVGALFLEEEGHIAFVTKINEEGFWIDEAGYEKCKSTKRFIKFNDPYNKLIGFYKP